jgi:glycosyltransferase involved in cell wall biosynthesis
MNPRILFVHNHPARFVQLDLALLRERYDVREWYQRTRWVNLPALTRAVAQSDLVYGWFASWHTFFPFMLARKFKRPSLLVVGGYDVANESAIGYGSQRGGIRRFIAQGTMRMANRLAAFSEFSRAEAIKNAAIPTNKVETIYIGLEACETKNIPKERFVVTVANVDRSNLQRKGLEAFVRAAAQLASVPIAVIGVWRDNSIKYLESIAPPNVRFTGRLSDTDLHDYLSRAKVYVQASRHEGFGLAVAEAMLHECVPVVTRAGALPELVGDCGIYIDSAEPAAIAGGVQRALNLDDELGHRARQRIVDHFPLARRKKGISKLIDQMLND